MTTAPIRKGKPPETLAEIRMIHVTVMGNMVSISLEMRENYEAQTLYDDLVGLLKAGRIIVLQANSKEKVR